MYSIYFSTLLRVLFLCRLPATQHTRRKGSVHYCRTIRVSPIIHVIDFGYHSPTCTDRFFVFLVVLRLVRVRDFPRFNVTLENPQNDIYIYVYTNEYIYTHTHTSIYIYI